MASCVIKKHLMRSVCINNEKYWLLFYMWSHLHSNKSKTKCNANRLQIFRPNVQTVFTSFSVFDIELLWTLLKLSLRMTVEAPVMQRAHPHCLPLEKWNPLRPNAEQVTPPPGHHKAQPQQKYSLVYRPCVLGTGVCLHKSFRSLLSDTSRQPNLTMGPSSASAVVSASGNAQLSVGDLHPADVPDAGPRGSHHRCEEVCVWHGGCVKESLFSCTDVQGQLFHLVSWETSSNSRCAKEIFFLLSNCFHSPL